MLGLDVSDNLIYHNNFVKTYPLQFNAFVMVKKNGNHWYNPTLKQGNYWSNYKGIDVLPPWGIGDIPKRIFPSFLGHKDKYPLMKPYDGTPINNQASQIAPHSNPQSNSQSQSSIQQSTTSSNSQTFQVIKTTTR